MKKILLDLRYRVTSGVSSCIRDLVPELIQYADYDWGIIKYPGQSFDFEDKVSFVLNCPAKSDLKDIFWSNTALVRYIRENKIDLYHGMKWTGPFFNPARSVHTAHSICHNYKDEVFPLNTKTLLYIYLYHKWGIKRCDRVIAISDFVKEFLTDCFSITEGKIRRIYNGIDPNCRVLEEKDRSRTISQRYGDKYYLTLGTVTSRKNQELALKALNVIQHEVDANLVIVGRIEEDYKQKLDHIVDKYGLNGRVFFTGYIGGEELIQVVNGASVLIHCALTEQFGLAILEAAKCGVPVIATRSRGILEYAQASVLFLDNPFDLEGLIAHLRALQNDPELNAEMKRKALVMTEPFDWKKAASEHIDLYEALLE